MVYETKGPSMEEVDELYEKVDCAWKHGRVMGLCELRGSTTRQAIPRPSIWGWREMVGT